MSSYLLDTTLALHVELNRTVIQFNPGPRQASAKNRGDVKIDSETRSHRAIATPCFCTFQAKSDGGSQRNDVGRRDFIEEMSWQRRNFVNSFWPGAAPGLAFLIVKPLG